jgi:hypothetical protein
MQVNTKKLKRSEILIKDKFIKTPNLPQAPVSVAIVDGRIAQELERSLYNLGIQTIKTSRIEGLYEAVAYHPDLQLLHLGDNRVIIAPNVENRFVYELEALGTKVVIGRKNIGKAYPENIAYNAARIGNRLFCKLAATDESILKWSSELGLELVDIKQGYSKCSICIFDENGLATSDKGIIKAGRVKGIDCLEIESGEIELEGLDYGFIGGASGFLSNSLLGFYGNIALNSNYEELKTFGEKFGKSLYSLGKNILKDYGTFIPLKEYSILNK